MPRTFAQEVLRISSSFNQSQHDAAIEIAKQHCDWMKDKKKDVISDVQINFCQKLLFLYQLTHNMKTDCSLNYKFNTWKFQAQTWGEHVVYKNCWMSETISVHNMFSPGLSLEFSCIELVIQWTICRHIVG